MVKNGSLLNIMYRHKTHTVHLMQCTQQVTRLVIIFLFSCMPLNVVKISL